MDEILAALIDRISISSDGQPLEVTKKSTAHSFEEEIQEKAGFLVTVEKKFYEVVIEAPGESTAAHDTV